MAARRVLILGGTREGRVLAEALVATPGVEVISSLAGRVRAPVLPAGEVRIGGFGGTDGLQKWLSDNVIDAIVDATHPFAAQITRNTAAAARAAGVPALVLHRPPWTAQPGDSWISVDSLAAAARAVPTHGVSAFLTIGRQGVEAFAGIDTVRFLIRAIDPPTGAVPARHELLLERGPFTVEHEIDLLRRHRIDVLVTKNSGGALTEAKLAAARTCGIRVVMIERPALPDGVLVVHTPADVQAWLAMDSAQRPDRGNGGR
ncbi:cobalt-precorrin-6A reductase [Aldersonia sp. NBC_00410]|uniref:cobalt-precorrin-6A reductase n=1 Tax=Aldersonia sp. NBC_00410 TaxID=2975954 RepID=UPI0022551414|nr:cobalt-precorrin-6A reductase [Aldersonia sp. NBC_00410]MCX5045815.1 cobalt-precorrin-6A reductase [Aldersonia sp. NBC_00410]